LVKVTFLMMI